MINNSNNNDKIDQLREKFFGNNKNKDSLSLVIPKLIFSEGEEYEITIKYANYLSNFFIDMILTYKQYNNKVNFKTNIYTH